jgi:type II secretory pathway pseudopilin PulG
MFREIRKQDRARRRGGGGGFTVIELLVVLGILVVLLAIFIPYLLSLRERSNRTTCADKLRQIRDALQAYALVNDHNFPSVRYDRPPAATPRTAARTIQTRSRRQAWCAPMT